jgi:hypothetical protein
VSILSSGLIFIFVAVQESTFFSHQGSWNIRSTFFSLKVCLHETRILCCLTQNLCHVT